MARDPHDQEGRIRRLEFQQLVARTERNSRRREEERSRQRRTELVAWLALLIAAASLIMNIVDKLS